MTLTWAKAGIILAAIGPPLAGGAYVSRYVGQVEMKVEAHAQQLATLAEVPAAVARIDERTIAIQRSIDEIKLKLNKE